MSSILIEALMKEGWSEAAARQLVSDAIATFSARKQQRMLAQAVSSIPYNKWLQQRFPSMTWDLPFQKYICSKIDDVLNGKLKNLIINLPPRVGKSEMVTIRLPIRWVEQNPSSRVIIGAYNKDLAKTFTARSLSLYRSFHPDDIDKEAEDEWSTKSGASVLAVGVGSGVTGRGADLLIFDDPVKGYEEAVSPAYQERTWQWWLNDFMTRRNQLERTPVIGIATRWDKNDLVGKILSAPGGDKWEVISLPAIAKEDNDILGRKVGESIWPERLPVEELRSIAEQMGIRYRALYDQDPVPAKGSLFDVSYFREEGGPPSGEPISSVRYWDLASSEMSVKNLDPDYTVGVRMYSYRYGSGTYEYYIDHIARIRANPGRRNEYILETALMDRDDGVHLQVFEETSKAEIVTLRDMLTPYGIQVDSVRSRLDKVTRTTNLRASFAQGLISYKRGMPNATEMIAECLSFPSGRHDDIVDAINGAHMWLVSHSLILSRR